MASAESWMVRARADGPPRSSSVDPRAPRTSAAREVATAPPTAQHTTRCLICREEVRTLELQQHTQECLLDLVSYTARTAAKALDDEGLSART